MKIVLQKKTTKKLKDFQEKEWNTADIYHYGKASNWKQKDLTVVAKEKSEIVGVVNFRAEAGVIWIGAIIVAHSRHGQGIGKELMKKVEEIGKDHNIHKIYLVTGKGWDSVPFYKSLGFEEIADLPKHYLQHDFVVMTKFI